MIIMIITITIITTMITIIIMVLTSSYMSVVIIGMIATGAYGTRWGSARLVTIGETSPTAWMPYITRIWLLFVLRPTSLEGF
jgi:hypothetical protein